MTPTPNQPAPRAGGGDGDLIGRANADAEEELQGRLRENEAYFREAL